MMVLIEPISFLLTNVVVEIASDSQRIVRFF